MLVLVHECVTQTSSPPRVLSGSGNTAALGRGMGLTSASTAGEIFSNVGGITESRRQGAEPMSCAQF